MKIHQEARPFKVKRHPKLLKTSAGFFATEFQVRLGLRSKPFCLGFKKAPGKQIFAESLFASFREALKKSQVGHKVPEITSPGTRPAKRVGSLPKVVGELKSSSRCSRRPGPGTSTPSPRSGSRRSRSQSRSCSTKKKTSYCSRERPEGDSTHILRRIV